MPPRRRGTRELNFNTVTNELERKNLGLFMLSLGTNCSDHIDLMHSLNVNSLESELKVRPPFMFTDLLQLTRWEKEELLPVFFNQHSTVTGAMYRRRQWTTVCSLFLFWVGTAPNSPHVCHIACVGVCVSVFDRDKERKLVTFTLSRRT